MLEKQAVAINIAEGIDTKTDSKHVVPGKLVRLENGVYRKNKRIDKRAGFDELPNKDIAGNTLGIGRGLGVFNDELLQYNSQKIFSYSSGASAWVDRGAAESVIVESRQIVKNTATQSQVDSASLNNIAVYAWEDSRGGVRASVYDESTGAALISDTSLDASASRVKCAAFNNFLFVFYYKSGSLYVQRLNPRIPTAFDSAVEVSSQVDTTNPNYDVLPYLSLRMLFTHNVMPVANVTTITAVADVSDSLDGTTFILQDEDGSVAFWFDVDNSGTTIPAEASAADRAVEITTIVTDDDAATVGGKIRTAVGADSKFSTSGTGADCIATDVAVGARAAADASTSGFTLVATTPGVSASIKVGWLDNTPAVQSGVLAPVYIAEVASGAITVIQGPTGSFYLAYYDGADVRCTILNNGAATLFAPFTVETIAGVGNITGYQVNAGNGVQLIYEIAAASSYNYYLKECFAENDGTAGTPSVFARSVGLFSKAFSYTDPDGNRNSFVGVSHDSTLQATYFVIRDDGLIVAKQQYTNGGGLTSRPLLATISAVSASLFSWSILKKNQIISENAIIFTPTGVMKTSLDFSNANIFIAKQLGNNLLIVGGVLGMYDGQSVVEHGFHLYPENVVAAAVGSGGSLANGAYLIYVVYEWTDQYGQIHRSQPSVAESVTCAAGGTDSITVTSPCLRLTRKDGTNRANVSIVGYVTEPGGTIPYRFTSVSTPILNDVTADTVSLGTITSVSTSNEILYTTGGVLPNTPAPACSVIEVFQNRVWLGGLEEGNKVIFSKENKQGAALEFTQDFSKAIESARGRVKAFAVLDDKFIITKSDRFYYTFGDGPNDTDTLGGFAEIQSATVDVGSSDPRSVASIPNGVIFKTAKGFYSIDSTLVPVYVGADVEAYNDLSLTSATLLADVNEVRFTTSDGDTLIYNYFFNRWSTANGLKATDANLFGNFYTVLKTDGRIFKQNSSVFKDSLDSYRLLIESGWISLNGVTAYKRIYELMILGEYKSTHKLRISISYDYSPAWEHSGIFDPDTNFPVELYGENSPYGSGSPYGGKSGGYIVRVRMKRQKCAAFKFKIEELVTTATAGTQESLTLSDIGMLIGVKKGQTKVSKGRTMGVK